MKKYLLVQTIFLLTLTVAKSQQGWQYQNSNLTNNQYGAIYALNKDTVFVIADSSKLLKTYDGGTNWILQNTGFSNYFFDLSFVNSDTGYAVGQNGTIIKTTNGGTNWSALTSGTNKDLFSISTKVLNNLWVVGDSGVILNSYDYGATWIKNDSLTKKQLNSICFRNSNIGFIAGNEGTLFMTVNGGANWDTLSIATTRDLFSLTVTNNFAYLLAGSMMNSSPFAYYFESDELFKTSDNVNWTSQYIPYFASGNSILYFQNDSLGFTVFSNCTTNNQCSIGIWKTTDYGQNWTYSLTSGFYSPTFSTFPGVLYDDIVFVSDSTGYLLSGNYILKTTDGGIFVNIKNLNDNNSIKIYPNPFSTQTTLQVDNLFHNATIKVYNCVGQTVKVIKNISGQTIILQRDNLSSGLYFLQLTQDNKILTTDKIVITDQ